MNNWLAEDIAVNEVDVLAKQWQEAKNAEDYAKERRLQIEAQITELVGVLDEGTSNAEGSHYKVKTVGKLTRSLDESGLQRDWLNLPDEVKSCIKWKPSIDTKALRSLESMRDDLVPVMAQYMTTKPAKPSIKIEEI